jgi:hypothetical protein
MLPATSADADAWARRVAAAGNAKALPTTLLPGYGLSAAQRDALVRALPDAACRDYIGECGCYPTAAAYGIAALFDEASASGIALHVNCDDYGTTAVVALRWLK